MRKYDCDSYPYSSLCASKLKKFIKDNYPTFENEDFLSKVLSYHSISNMCGPGFAPGIRGELSRDALIGYEEDEKKAIRNCSSKINDFYHDYVFGDRKENTVKSEVKPKEYKKSDAIWLGLIISFSFLALMYINSISN